MKAISFALAVVLLLTPATVVRAITFSPSDGEIGVYLVGAWDIRGVGPYTRQSTLQIINPQRRPLQACIVFYDDNANWVRTYDSGLLDPNELLELDVNATLFGQSATFGVVKILSGDADIRLQHGLVAYKKELLTLPRVRGVAATPLTMSETRLQPVPMAVLLEDIDPLPGNDHIKTEFDLLYSAGCTFDLPL